jgi:D-alanyl-D-alanine carboxypeptidase/D-alanyl-D-alanine-endopeptidase (penicillin-binding protein 4)
MMQPASTMKMYTTALALDRFGPDYQFKTTVLRDGVIGPDSVLHGNLYLRGDGDPSLSPRLWNTDNPMDSLARQIIAAGVKRITGDVVGDATAFDSQLVPDGWKARYLGAAYAARVSALSLNENLVWVVVQPDGKKAVISLDPATTTLPVESSVRVVAGSRGRISAIRRKDGVIQVRGTIGEHSGPLRYSLVVDNPASFTAGALRAALDKIGIAVDGHVGTGGTPANATPIATVASPELATIVAEMNRESINLFAELLFRSAGRAAAPGQVGSAQTGLMALRSFLTEKVGARGDEVQASDGSGLSVLDRVTPRSMVELLAFAHRAPWGPTFHASLPLEGESGTLRHRARYTPARGNLHAKTGTTNTVASLGGYVTAKNGEILAFSFIYNGSDRWNAKRAMDQMGATLAEFVR